MRPTDRTSEELFQVVHVSLWSTARHMKYCNCVELCSAENGIPTRKHGNHSCEITRLNSSRTFLLGPIRPNYCIGRDSPNSVMLIVVDTDYLAPSPIYNSTYLTSSQCAHGHLDAVNVVSHNTYFKRQRSELTLQMYRRSQAWLLPKSVQFPSRSPSCLRLSMSGRSNHAWS